MAKVIEGLLGTHVISGHVDTQDKVAVSSMCGRHAVVGLYFSAHWCPPCRGFTPLLVDFYNSLKLKNGDVKLEIVFVSWDKDVSGFWDHFSAMPWLALPFDPDKQKKVRTGENWTGVFVYNRCNSPRCDSEIQTGVGMRTSLFSQIYSLISLVLRLVYDDMTELKVSLNCILRYIFLSSATRGTRAYSRAGADAGGLQLWNELSTKCSLNYIYFFYRTQSLLQTGHTLNYDILFYHTNK